MNDTPCIIVNMGEPLDPDIHGNSNIIPPTKRPRYVHDDLESAQREALRLHTRYAGPTDRFVIFQAIEASAWKTTWDGNGDVVAALDPYAPPVPFIIPERARKPRKKGKS